MRNITEDALKYLDTGEVPEQWIVNDIGTKEQVANEEFIDEVNLQEQIKNTELNESS